MDSDNYEFKDYLTNGYITFFVDQNQQIAHHIVTKKEILNDYPEIIRQTASDHLFTHLISHMFSGLDFLDHVKQHGITDDDGDIQHIFVDEMESNLGLYYPSSFEQGSFLVCAEQFEEICKNHDVKVDWANK